MLARLRLLLPVLVCLALVAAAVVRAQSGAGLAHQTCGALAGDGDLYRDQARLLVDREGLRARALTTEQIRLGVELALRRACRGAGRGYQPYDPTVRGRPGPFIQGP